MRRYKRSEGTSIFLIAFIAIMSTLKSNEIYNYLDKNVFKNVKEYAPYIESELSKSLEQSKYKDLIETLMKNMKESGISEEYINEYFGNLYNAIIGTDAGIDTENTLQTKITQLNGETIDLFTKYDLLDEQIKKIANVCVREQGHFKKGIAAEASLMANRFEIDAKGIAHGKTGGEGLFEYIRNGSENDLFFDTKPYGGKYNTPHLMDTGEDHEGNDCTPTDEEIEIVRKVLVEGKRILPGYVNEHDCILSVAKATNEGNSISNTRDMSQYISGVTKIRNTSMDENDSAYTFYGFLSEKKDSDPFSYTSEEYKRKVGEAYYDFETWELVNAPENIVEQLENQNSPQTLGEKQEYIMNFLSNGFENENKKYEGFEDVQVAAIMGNIKRESDFDETNSTGQYKGLIQWSEERTKGLEEYAKSKGTTIDDLDTQLEYIFVEFYDRPEQWTGGEEEKEKFLKCNDVKEATTIYLVENEMGKIYNGESEETIQQWHESWDLDDGYKAAEEFYEIMQEDEENSR